MPRVTLPLIGRALTSIVISAAFVLALPPVSGSAADLNLTQYVNPFIGTDHK